MSILSVNFQNQVNFILKIDLVLKVEDEIDTNK